MATTTTNLALIKPSGTDKIRIAQINSNMDTIDEKMGAVGNTSLQAQVTAINSNTNNVESGIAIVVNGNKTTKTGAIGQYVLVKNSSISGISNGMYTAAKAIPANTTLDSTYFTSVPNGGLNSLYTTLNSKFGDLEMIFYSEAFAIPDGRETPQTVSIDLSSVIPSGKTLKGISNARYGTYILPYVTAGQIATQVLQYNGTTLTLRSIASAWSSRTFSVILFVG